MQNEKQNQLRKACEDFMDNVREIVGTNWLESITKINISIHCLPDEFFTSEATDIKEPYPYNNTMGITKSESLIKNRVHLFSKETTTKLNDRYVNKNGETLKYINDASIQL